LGVTNDNAEAVKWIRKAAKQSYPDGEYFLGFFYESGIGMAEDQKWWAF
jgi:TPR repeat protein